MIRYPTKKRYAQGERVLLKNNAALVGTMPFYPKQRMGGIRKVNKSDVGPWRLTTHLNPIPASHALQKTLVKSSERNREPVDPL